MPRRPTRPQIVTTQALRLALSPDWTEGGAATWLVELVGGSELVLRRSLARLDYELLQQHSPAVERASRSLRAALGQVRRNVDQIAG